MKWKKTRRLKLPWLPDNAGHVIFVTATPPPTLMAVTCVTVITLSDFARTWVLHGLYLTTSVAPHAQPTIKRTSDAPIGLKIEGSKRRRRKSPKTENTRATLPPSTKMTTTALVQARTLKSTKSAACRKKRSVRQTPLLGQLILARLHTV